MTIEQQIDAAITKAETVSFTWADLNLAQLSNGEDVTTEIKLYLLGQWIWILKDYKIYNFGDNGAITPEYTCVTLQEINLLIAKINALEC